MSKSTLKLVRLLAPGVIALVCTVPYFKLRDFKTISDNVHGELLYSLLAVIAVIIGGFYYGFGGRNILWRKFVAQCHKNVRDKMIDMHHHDLIIGGEIERLTGKEAMRIFYSIIDNDPSLSDQAQDVRLNGVVLTTIIDSIIILPFFTITYIVGFRLTGQIMYIVAIVFAVLLEVALWVLKSRVSKKHIGLQNEQLAVIKQRHSDALRDQLQRIICNSKS